MGLDVSVWVVMLIVCIISLALLAYTKITEEPCTRFTVSVKDYHNAGNNNYHLKEVLNFSSSAVTKEKKNIVWDFGDGTPQGIGGHVTHIYYKEGPFTVNATANGSCTETRLIYIRARENARQPSNSGILGNNIINGDFELIAGQKGSYSCNYSASEYEWHIVDRTNFPVKTGKEAEFYFRVPGSYTLQLKLDNDPEKIFIKNIVVDEDPLANISPLSPGPVRSGNLNKGKEDKNGSDLGQAAGDTTAKVNIKLPHKDTVVPPPPVEPKREPLITADRTFLVLLQGVNNGAKEIQDFDDYLCEKGNTEVVINEKERTTLTSLCNKIRKHEKFRVEAVQAVRGDHKCVKSLNVVIKRKTLLSGWVIVDKLP
jgi:hypothetical protein